jgi:hypothetical protein
MEARKPLAQQRPEPQPPLSMARPSDVHDQPLVAAWAEAVKEVMPRDDGSNPNGECLLPFSHCVYTPLRMCFFTNILI